MTSIEVMTIDRASAINLRRIAAFCAPSVAGIAIVLLLWWLAGMILDGDPQLAAFRGFSPGRTLSAFADLLASGDAWRAIAASLLRVVQGLGWAFVIGAPTGLAIGSLPLLDRMVQLPFQILRMVSPLAWMPIAVLAFPGWNGAIVFLIAAAAVWPIVFATAASVKKVDPLWLAMARNLGGSAFSVLGAVIIPAVAQDIWTGLRLALGVAWIVLVPAEFLGVTSGLGYAINDARDTLSYDRLAALILLIGLIGYLLDAAIGTAIRRSRWMPAA